MARFVFRLEPVLRQRRSVERLKQQALAKVQIERVALEEAIRECGRGIEAAKQEWRSQLAAGGVADLRGARLQAGASLHLTAQAQRAVIKLAGVVRRQEQARAELAAASARVKAVELLREAQLERWREEQNRIENAALDEIVTMRAGTVEEAA
ncbi:MAG: flagellar export protein FliJ [Planctomycetes bacterium]|nr:flagellar export protein FliJ [Planctomycetota bacterium]